MKTIIHLLHIASRHHQNGDLSQAETVYRQILETQPENADVFHLLGLISFQRNCFTDAVSFISRAVAIDPLELAYLFSLGSIYSAVEKSDDAIKCYEKILEICPDSVEAYFCMGSILEQQEEIDEAIAHYQRASQINSGFLDAYIQEGRLLRVKGELEKAVEVYTVAETISPSSAEVCNGLGLVLVEQGKLEEASEVYKRAVSIKPGCAEIHNNLGFVLQKQNEWEDAAQHYNHAIFADPEYAEAYNNFGNLRQEQNQFKAAIECYRRAISVDPDYAEAYSNLGAALQGDGDFSEAAEAHRCALKIGSNQAKLHFNYGVFCQYQGRLEEAIQAYKSAISLNHDFADAHKNLGMLLLLKGDFLNGWKEYEWRWNCDDFGEFWSKRNFPQPLLDDPDVQGKSILIWAEQGVGDQIMFASMLNGLDCFSNEIVVECEERLVPLFQRSFPNVSFISAKTPPDGRLFDQRIDCQIPIGNLGKWFRVTESDFCGSKPYLVSCPDRVMSFKKKYKALAEDRLLVGISWRSTRVDQRRAMLKSTDLNQWFSLLSEKNCFFVNLQYGDAKQEIEGFIAETNVRIYDDETVDSLQNLDDFAAQISSLDLIVSTSNTTVHVAGALGKPVWNLIPYLPDWRWTVGRQNSLWYPTMKLFRQKQVSDWNGVFQQVAHSLKELLTHEI